MKVSEAVVRFYRVLFGFAVFASSSIVMAGPISTAGSPTIGSMANQAGSSVKAAGDLLEYIFYPAGLFFAILSVTTLNAWRNDKQRHSIGNFFICLILTVLCFFMPTVVGGTGATLLGSGAQSVGREGIF